jgi:hypothetical protein
LRSAMVAGLLVPPSAFPCAVVRIFTSATRVASNVARLANRVALPLPPTPAMTPLQKRRKLGRLRRLPMTGTAR